jgi:hypothetical protein
MTTQSRGREADARMYWLTTTRRRQPRGRLRVTTSLCHPRRPVRTSVIDTRLWRDVARLELLVKVSPAVNEVNLGFHHVRAR